MMFVKIHCMSKKYRKTFWKNNDYDVCADLLRYKENMAFLDSYTT